MDEGENGCRDRRIHRAECDSVLAEEAAMRRCQASRCSCGDSSLILSGAVRAVRCPYSRIAYRKIPSFFSRTARKWQGILSDSDTLCSSAHQCYLVATAQCCVGERERERRKPKGAPTNRVIVLFSPLPLCKDGLNFSPTAHCIATKHTGGD